MFILSVNGKEYSSESDKKLLSFLRDDLHLTGTKDGCSEGACGACTVIVDGESHKGVCLHPLTASGKEDYDD